MDPKQHPLVEKRRQWLHEQTSGKIAPDICSAGALSQTLAQYQEPRYELRGFGRHPRHCSMRSNAKHYLTEFASGASLVQRNNRFSFDLAYRQSWSDQQS